MDIQNMEQQNMEKEKERIYRMGIRRGIFATVLIVALLVAAVLTLWFAVRGAEGVKQESLFSEGSIIDENMVKKLNSLERIIQNYYYQDDVDAVALEEGVYHGILDAIGDPYSCYYTVEELAELMEHTEGVYYGIGAYVGLDTATGYPKIISAIPGTPAEEADLRPDDIIYEVNGESVQGKDLDSVVAMIKGEEGTIVTLTIIRSTEPDYLYVDIERRQVESPTITSEMLEDGMAYIQITEFSSVSVNQFADALATARESGMKGLIIDLRANPGGSLDAVVDIARMLLPEGLIVYTEDKYGMRQEYSCDGTHEFELPLVVLVDGNSASASEVLAGAIKDYGKGTLVGTTTFGKGIVQQLVGLADGSAVKITVSSYYSPKGNNIHGTGIEPDLVCEFDGEAYYNEDYDNQLEYAKEVLAEMINKQ